MSGPVTVDTRAIGAALHPTDEHGLAPADELGTRPGPHGSGPAAQDVEAAPLRDPAAAALIREPRPAGPTLAPLAAATRVAGPDAAAASARPWQQLAAHFARLDHRPVGGHQGAVFGGFLGIFPVRPNTMSAFEQALAAGADIIETDLRATKDGRALVFHDENLKLMTDGTADVRDLTLAEAQRASYTLSGEPLPSFEELLRWAAAKRAAGIPVVLNPELKDVEAADDAVRLIQQYGAHAWVFLQAKGGRERYERVRALDPEVLLSQTARNEAELQRLLDLNDPALLVIELHRGEFDQGWIDRIHAAGKLALEDTWHYAAWYNPHELFGSQASTRRALAAGIDILITDRVRGALAAQRRE